MGGELVRAFAGVASVRPALPGCGAFQRLDQRRAGIPGGAALGRQDVVAGERGDGERGDVLDPERAGERRVLFGDAPENVLGVADRVHPVDREDGLADAHQQGDMAVPPGLGHDPLAGIDQN